MNDDHQVGRKSVGRTESWRVFGGGGDIADPFRRLRTVKEKKVTLRSCFCLWNWLGTIEMKHRDGGYHWSDTRQQGRDISSIIANQRLSICNKPISQR